MEVFNVNSLLELRQLRHLSRFFPNVIFTGGYVRVRVLVERLDRAMHSRVYRRILTAFVNEFNWEVPSLEMIEDVIALTESLMVIKGTAEGAALSNPLSFEELYDERTYLRIARAAQIAHETRAYLGDKHGLFDDGIAGDLLFATVNSAVSCANSALDLLERNITNAHGWGRMITRLATLRYDADRFLRSPVLF